MKLHRETISLEERMALGDKLAHAAASVPFDTRYGGNIVAIDSDFLPTNNINNARWLYSSNHYSCAIVRINADGSMTQIEA